MRPGKSAHVSACYKPQSIQVEVAQQECAGTRRKAPDVELSRLVVRRRTSIQHLHLPLQRQSLYLQRVLFSSIGTVNQYAERRSLSEALRVECQTRCVNERCCEIRSHNVWQESNVRETVSEHRK